MFKRRSRSAGSFEASSMADIAFLLLIFFMVVTQIQAERGLPTVLPPWDPTPKPPVAREERNVLRVAIGPSGQLMVDDAFTDNTEFPKLAHQFLANRGQNPAWSDRPSDAVYEVKTQRATPYASYIEVMDGIRAAYRKEREAWVKDRHGRQLSELGVADSLIFKALYAEIPVQIVEPTPQKLEAH